VEWGEARVALDALDDRVVDQHGGSEVLASMHDAVADGADLVETIENLPVPLAENPCHLLRGYRVVGDLHVVAHLRPSLRAMVNHGVAAVLPDPLDEAGSERFLCVCLE